jgi:hypothetical protein
MELQIRIFKKSRPGFRPHNNLYWPETTDHQTLNNKRFLNGALMAIKTENGPIPIVYLRLT